MSTSAGQAGVVIGEDRHASWLELFFDLVAVAGIGALAHLLEADDSGTGLALYVIAFAAIWTIWACFTVYANIRGDEVRTSTMLLGMVVLGVMIAAIPEIRVEHATEFAVAYVVGRMIAARPWQRATVVVDLPVVQASFGVIPWVVSWWFDGTAQYTLWAVGLGLDLLLQLTTTPEKLVAESQAKLDWVLRIRRTRSEAADSDRRPRRGREIPTTIDAADADVPHLGERLGLFVLIVLGEGLVQIIDGAGEAPWDRALAVTGAGAFALVFGLWGLAVRYGSAGVALLPEGGLSPRLSWAAHLVATLTLATVAAVLGSLVSEPGEDLSDHVRWLVVTAYAGYALLSSVVLIAGGSSVRAACVGVPLALSAAVVAVAPGMAAEGVVWILAAGALAAVLAHRRTTATDREAT
jgi:low temperature requirement protein LtrA